MGSKSHFYSHNHAACWVAFLPAILLLVEVISGHVFAQEGNANENPAGAAAAGGSYAEDPVDQNLSRKFTSDIAPILRAGKFNDDKQQNDFDTYYKNFSLPRWTQLSALADLKNSPRKELLNSLRQAKKGQVHDHLNDLVLEYMNKLANSDKYHPAVRYNAMLAIGDLNADDTGTSPPPLESALPVLLATVNDPKQIDPVKIAALIGVNRHVTVGVVNPQIQNQILGALLKIVAGADAADSSDPGRNWMRKQAVEILGLLGNVGVNNQVVQVLSAIIGDTKASFSMRSTAAESLGKLKFAGAGGLNPLDLAKPLGQLMLDACDAELKSVKDTKLPVSRRRMKALLSAVMEGLKGIKPLAKDPPQQTSLNNLQTIFDNLFKELDKDTSKIKGDEEEQKYNDDLKSAVEDCRNKLNGWLEKKP